MQVSRSRLSQRVKLLRRTRPTARSGHLRGVVRNNVQAWALGGPVYVAGGGGVRLGFNGGRMGLLLGARLVPAFGNGFTFSIEPDIGLQYGF
jgi:hypothetical protein